MKGLGFRASLRVMGEALGLSSGRFSECLSPSPPISAGGAWGSIMGIEIVKGEKMEDSYAPFVDLLDENRFEEQVVVAANPGDFTHLYEFVDAYADFVPWNVVSEIKGGSHTSQSDTVTEIETEISQKQKQKQKQDGGIKLEEWGFANLRSDEGLKDATTTKEWLYPQGKMHYPEIDQDTDILQSEMFELLDMFEAVQGQITSREKMAILRKCIHVCQQIIERGNPIRAPLPQVVTILGEAKSMLQLIEKEEVAGIEVGAKESEERAAESVHMSLLSFKDLLQTEVKEALERADREEEQATNAVLESEDEDEDEGIEEGVYVWEGIWYCKEHKLEQCDDCNVDHRLLNQARRSKIGGVKVDVKVLRKEQQRLLESEIKSFNSDENIQKVTKETHDDDQDLEDFDSIAKELKEELARAREMEEADFLKYFASFQISNDRKLPC